MLTVFGNDSSCAPLPVQGEPGLPFHQQVESWVLGTLMAGKANQLMDTPSQGGA